jgi:hypothetical protein
MRKLILALVVTYTLTASGAEVVRAAPWELHSSFWMSLHQTLIADAMRSKPRDLASWTAEEQKVWNAAVAAYRVAGHGSRRRPDLRHADGHHERWPDAGRRRCHRPEH